MTELPKIAAAVLADVLDQLPPRLRRRLDAALPNAAGWTIETGKDTATARAGEDAILRWVLHDGMLTAAADLTCACLLAPNCLHRAVAVAAAPVADVDTAPPAEPTVESTVEPAAAPVTPAERAAATALATAAGAILHAGATGGGTARRAELLRAVHAARITGLYRPAATGLRIAAALADAVGDRTVTRAELAEELTELLLSCHDLANGVGDAAALRGVARHEYRPVGRALRLTGLCTETVCTASGYAGVVSHVVDADGELWTISGVLPGGQERVPIAANAGVPLGESGLSHRELARRGLLVSAGTMSPDRRLGAAPSVRAVAAAGMDWSAEPSAGLWRRPLAEQVRAALASADLPDGLRPSGAGLLFLTARVIGLAGEALRVMVADGAVAVAVDLAGSDATAVDNLRLLAGLAGAELRVVARLRIDRPATATAIAVRADPEALRLPAAWGVHVDLGLDRLQRSFLGDAANHTLERLPDNENPAEHPAGAIRLLERWVQRVVMGGRSMAVVASADADRARLARVGLAGTARLLGELTAAARDQHRDAFGRLVTDDNAEFVRAWLRAGVFLRAAHRHGTERSWSAW